MEKTIQGLIAQPSKRLAIAFTNKQRENPASNQDVSCDQNSSKGAMTKYDRAASFWSH